MTQFSFPNLQNDRQSRLEKMQFILAAFLLTLAVLSRIDIINPPIPVFEWIYITVLVLTAIANLLLALIGSRLTDIRKKNRLIRIVFLMTGFVLMMEAIDSIRVGTQYLHFVKFFAASLFLLLAVFYNRLHGSRGIRLTDESLLVRSSLIHSSFFQWKEIEQISLEEGQLSITLRGERGKTFIYSELSQRSDFVEAIKKYSAGRNITLDLE